MLSISDVIAKRGKLKETSNQYVPQTSSTITKNFKTNARIYSLISEYCCDRFGANNFKLFIKHPRNKSLVVSLTSPNNSLVASLNLNKAGLLSTFKDILAKEQLIDDTCKMELIPRLG